MTRVHDLPEPIKTQVLDLADEFYPKACFHNATVVARELGATYCEGELHLSGIAIEHAWNGIDVDGQHLYIDVTLDLVLAHDVENDHGLVVEGKIEDLEREYDFDNIKSLMVQYLQKWMDKNR